MTQRVYLHVGPHKTGTTYVQGLLAANRARLAEAGMLYPLPTLRAVQDVMGRGGAPGRPGYLWQTLLLRLRAWHGPSAVISHEVISTATDADISRFVAGLGRFDLHIVYAARDLSRVVPAMWQTGLRGTRSYTWAEYARSLEHPSRGGLPWGRRFWHSQDAPRVLQRWRAHLPPENLHVVTVPRPGNPPELLWHRFCTVLGLDPAGHQLDPPRSNPSLGTAEAELLRRVNAAMAGSEQAADVDGGVRLASMRWLGRELETRERMAKFTLPAEDLDWVARRAQQVVSGLRDGGYDVVGDLADLVPQPVPAEQARHPADISPEAVLDGAVDTIRLLLLERSHRQARHRTRASRLVHRARRGLRKYGTA